MGYPVLTLADGRKSPSIFEKPWNNIQGSTGPSISLLRISENLWNVKLQRISVDMEKPCFPLKMID
jgi:hypothetical protein